jgi:hypothetical protein
LSFLFLLPLDESDVIGYPVIAVISFVSGPNPSGENVNGSELARLQNRIPLTKMRRILKNPVFGESSLG